MNRMFEGIRHYFDLEGRKTTLGRELRGASATFLTMSYILFVNAAILKPAVGEAIPTEALIAATALAAAFSCLLMGVTANFPVALASGMGLNAVVAGLVASPRPLVENWQTAMGLVVWDGVIILLLVLAGVRETMLQAIPRDLRLAIGAGIGLFIAFIGLVNARITVANPYAPVPPVLSGSLAVPETIVGVVGLIFTSLLLSWRIRGALLLGIAGSTGLAALLGLVHWQGLRAPSFETLGQANVLGALRWQYLPPLLALLMVDFFDTLGTVSALAEQAQLHTERGEIPQLRRILLVDALSASIGGMCGASSVTAYIESAAGIAEGARTGLHTVLVGLFFLLAIVLAPLAALVPQAATAPALIIVGFLMARQITGIRFEELETGLPAFVTLVTLPLTYSIAHGVGYGFLTFVALKVLRFKFREVHPVMYLAAILFTAYFVFEKA